MDRDFLSAIEQICEERGISKEKVLETIEMAIAAAYKKEHGRKGQNIRAKLDLVTGEAKMFQVKLVVDESMLKPELEEGEELVEDYSSGDFQRGGKYEDDVPEEERKIRFNEEKHIMIDEAKKLDKDINVKDEMSFSLEADQSYGRIAAQTAKQVIVQRIREAEKEAVFEEYKEKEGQVVSGMVQRIERGNALFDLGRGNGILPKEEQILGEYYRIGQRFRIYILEVQKGPQGSAILLSRVRPEMISRLFEIEVPEIAAGTVIIKSVAREAGSRSKIAVMSTEEKIDPIGSLVGQKGTRVQAVINELGGEKIDIIQWDEIPAKFVAYALAPAKVVNVVIRENERKAIVSVPEDQLSLAIGKRGQNVRLAAKLTGWKIDIISAKGEKIEVEEEAVKSEKELEKVKKEEVGRVVETAEAKENETDEKKQMEKAVEIVSEEEKAVEEKQEKKEEVAEDGKKKVKPKKRGRKKKE